MQSDDEVTLTDEVGRCMLATRVLPPLRKIWERDALHNDGGREGGQPQNSESEERPRIRVGVHRYFAG